MQLSDTNRSRAWTTRFQVHTLEFHFVFYFPLFGFQWTFDCSLKKNFAPLAHVGTANWAEVEHAPLAQLVEQLTLNQWVPGSNPWRCTIVGIFNDEGPPVPIPNTEVKLTCAEDTWLEAARKNRSSPTFLLCLFFLILYSSIAHVVLPTGRESYVFLHSSVGRAPDC